MDNPADNPIRCGGSACSIPFRDAILVLFAPAFLWVALGVGTAIPMFQSSGWPATALLILAALAGLVSESSRLPAQNVLFAAAVIAVVTGAVHAVNLFSGIPFGPIIYTDASGPKYFATLPWFVPLIGIASILLSRGVARMILRPWRKTRLYGFRVIGLTVILVILLEAGMEVFASRTSGFWFWQPTKLPLDWGGVSLFRLLGGALVTLLVLVLITHC